MTGQPLLAPALGTSGPSRLDRGTAVAFLEIPPRFHEQLVTGEPTAVQLLVDTTNSPQGLSAAYYAARIVARIGQETALARVGWLEGSSQNLPVIESGHRVWYKPGPNEAWFESISHLLRQITIFAILLPAAALVREKERGTVEQLLVSPLTPLQIMLPKVLATTMVILCATAVGLFGIMQLVFGVPINGSIGLFFGLTTLFVFTTAGMGLAAATLARNQAQVGLMTLLVVGPMLLLSGLMAPMEAMPRSTLKGTGTVRCVSASRTGFWTTSPGVSRVPAKALPSMAVSPQTSACTSAPSRPMPPSATSGISSATASRHSTSACSWGTPKLVVMRVVQPPPGPMPTLIPSAPRSRRKSAPSEVTLVDRWRNSRRKGEGD